MKLALVILGSFVIIGSIIIEYIYPDKLPSNLILGITAIIVLWYTWETNKIREAESVIAKISSENYNRIIRPIVSYGIITNEDKPFDIGFEIQNLSENPVAALVKFIFRFEGNLIDNLWSEYNGKKYWNLQYHQHKYGHFNYLELFHNTDIFSEEDIIEMKNSSKEQIREKVFADFMFKYGFEKLPVFSIDIEVYCKNDLQQTTYYSPVNYKLEPYKLLWIPSLTSEKPYWDYNITPEWVK